jgi:exosortase O
MDMQSFLARRISSQRLHSLVAIGANLVLLGLWLWSFRQVYPYLRIIFTHHDFRTNQIVLLAALILVVRQARLGQFSLVFNQLPQLYLPALGLALAGVGAFLAADRWLDINTLSATLFGIASYGLLGLWMSPGRWRQGLPAALLLVGALPFGEHMDTFIGFPLRLVTARTIGQGLAVMGFPNVSVDTILVFENGLSQVDSPCSGVKSLWTGGLFFLAATWIERRPVNARWLISGVTFAGLLVAANFARVGILVLVGQVAGARLLAEMLHVPLGVIGFIAACTAALRLLRWSGLLRLDSRPALRTQPTRPRWLIPALAALLVMPVFAYAPDRQSAAAAVPVSFAPDWQPPPELHAQPWPLEPDELDWLSDRGALPVAAIRWRFDWQGKTGSLLFVASNNWRTQHRPERCFTVYGLEVEGERLHLASPGFPMRWLNLRYPGGDQPLYNAAYWLQSKDRITDDYSVRIWDDLTPEAEPWVLVTVLFDQPVDTDDSRITGIFPGAAPSRAAGFNREPAVMAAATSVVGIGKIVVGPVQILDIFNIMYFSGR